MMKKITITFLFATALLAAAFPAFADLLHQGIAHLGLGGAVLMGLSIGKTERKASPYSNVVAAGVATNKIIPGNTLLNLQLVLGGTALTKAMLSLIEVKVNEKTVMYGTGTQFDLISAYRGIASNAAFLDLPFEDLTGLDQLDRNIGALDTTRGIETLTTEITIAGATAPTLAGYLHETAPQKSANGQPSPFAGLMCKYLRYPFAVANGGELPIDLPFGPKNGAVIKRAHFFHSGNLTGIVVKENSIVKHDSVIARNEYNQGRFGRVPQANVYTVDFILDGNVANAFDTRDSNTVEWIPSFSAADNGFVIVEYLDRLDNL